MIEQLKSNISAIVCVLILSLLVLGSVFLFHYFYDVPLKLLTRDVTSAAEVPLYIGIQSQIGVLFWAASTTVCFICARIVQSADKSFFVVSGFISLLLGLDDMFLFHEIVFPSIGIHQKIVYLGYGILMGVYLIHYRNKILNTNYVLLILAIGSFGISLTIDNFFYKALPFISAFFEDGAKFIGILFWTIYFYKSGLSAINRQLKSTSSISV